MIQVGIGIWGILLSLQKSPLDSTLTSKRSHLLVFHLPCPPNYNMKVFFDFLIVLEPLPNPEDLFT